MKFYNFKLLRIENINIRTLSKSQSTIITNSTKDSLIKGIDFVGKHILMHLMISIKTVAVVTSTIQYYLHKMLCSELLQTFIKLDLHMYI